MPTLTERSADNTFVIVMLVSLCILVTLCLTISFCACCKRYPPITPPYQNQPSQHNITLIESPGESPESQFFSIGSVESFV